MEELREFYAEEKDDMNVDSEAPAKVQAVPRLKDDLTALIYCWMERNHTRFLFVSKGMGG